MLLHVSYNDFIGHIPETVWVISDSEGKFTTAKSSYKFSSQSEP